MWKIDKLLELGLSSPALGHWNTLFWGLQMLGNLTSPTFLPLVFSFSALDVEFTPSGTELHHQLSWFFCLQGSIL